MPVVIRLGAKEMGREKGGLSKGAAEPEKLPLVLTIGHSTRSLKDFINLLKIHGVKMIVDVRTVPRSHCSFETFWFKLVNGQVSPAPY